MTAGGVASPLSGKTAIALVFVMFVAVLTAITTWVVFAHRRRLRLRLPPTTQVEAQVQVQVQVEQFHEATPSSSCQVLPFPATTSCPRSSSDTWLQRILGRHRGKPQPPAKKEEKWFAFDSNATLATLDHDPLEDDTCDVPPTPTSESGPGGSASSPSLVSGPTTPASSPGPHTPTPRTSAIPDAASSDYEMDLSDIKIDTERYSALIHAISASFSVSSLGLPTISHSRDRSPPMSDCNSKDGDDSDSAYWSADDGEWDLGTLTIHESYSQCEDSVFAI